MIPIGRFLMEDNECNNTLIPFMQLVQPTMPPSYFASLSYTTVGPDSSSGFGTTTTRGHRRGESSSPADEGARSNPISSRSSSSAAAAGRTTTRTRTSASCTSSAVPFAESASATGLAATAALVILVVLCATASTSAAATTTTTISTGALRDGGASSSSSPVESVISGGRSPRSANYLGRSSSSRSAVLEQSASLINDGIRGNDLNLRVTGGVGDESRTVSSRFQDMRGHIVPDATGSSVDYNDAGNGLNRPQSRRYLSPDVHHLGGVSGEQENSFGNRMKRFPVRKGYYYHYGGYPTDVGGSGYPPYYVGRKLFVYPKSKYPGDIPFFARLFLDALATHTRPIIDVG